MDKTCKTEGCKGESGFGVNRDRADGLSDYCRACNNSIVQEWRHKNPDKARESVRKYARSHSDSVKAGIKAWRKRNPEQSRASSDSWAKRNPELNLAFQVRYKYGITLEEYRAMVDRHAGKCGACSREARLFVDHCHTTKRVRGMLCHHCNSALGLLKDDPARIVALGEYLKNTSCN